MLLLSDVRVTNYSVAAATQGGGCSNSGAVATGTVETAVAVVAVWSAVMMPMLPQC